MSTNTERFTFYAREIRNARGEYFDPYERELQMWKAFEHMLTGEHLA